MQAAVAHMVGTGTQNPGGMRAAHTAFAFEQESGRVVLWLLGLKPGTNAFVTLEGLPFQQQKELLRRGGSTGA